MKNRSKIKTQFLVDSVLISKDLTELLVSFLNQEKIKFFTSLDDINAEESTIVFVEKKNLRKCNHIKHKLIIFPATELSEKGNVAKLSLNSLEEISSFVEKVIEAERNVVINERIRASERLFENGKKYLEELSVDDHLNSTKKLYDSLMDLELLLLQEENIVSWNIHFKNFIKKNNNDLISLLVIKYEDMFYEDLTFDENVICLKLPVENKYVFLKFKNFDLKKDSEFVDLLVHMIVKTLNSFDQKLVKDDGEIDFWKKIFSKIPYPMAVISNLGDLLIYNESFAKMGLLPKECQRFKDSETTEIFQNFYKIRRIDFPINLIQVSYFVFYAADKSQTRSVENESQLTNNKKSKVDELGIISSSIAHELNNPLAGILAALSLLSLEDTWSDEAQSDIEDMKSGAKRCKELVEIFLGFSRFSPNHLTKISIKDSLDQAINLLRFRMIESNLRLEMKYRPTLEQFSHQLNPSVISMIFYLVCSELMTAFAHHRLITESHHALLSGEVLDLSNQIILKLEDEFEYEEKIAQSKLIQHLLIFEKLEINFLKQEIRLIYRT